MPLPTVLLRHDLPSSTHYDWLMVDPRLAGDPESRLWAARVGIPSDEWARVEMWELEVIAPHRRHYLTYEGPVGPAGGAGTGGAGVGVEGRGTVRRVDEGTFEAEVWTDERFVIELHFRQVGGRIEAEKTGPSLWRARLAIK